MMETAFTDNASEKGASPGGELRRFDNCPLPASTGQPQPELSLRHEIKLALIGLTAGILMHVLYVFIMAMLPVQGSGAARLGERFADFF